MLKKNPLRPAPTLAGVHFRCTCCAGAACDASPTLTLTYCQMPALQQRPQASAHLPLHRLSRRYSAWCNAPPHTLPHTLMQAAPPGFRSPSVAQAEQAVQRVVRAHRYCHVVRSQRRPTLIPSCPRPTACCPRRET